MRVGWRQYLKQRFQKSSKFYSVGIELGDQHLHLSVFQQVQGQLTWVKQQRFNADDWFSQLKTYIEAEHLANTPCHLAFTPSHYQLLQVDRPQVPESEIAQALSWSIKDLVAVEGDLVVDFFELPAQAAAADKVNAVALPKTLVQETSKTLLEAGLNSAEHGYNRTSDL